MRLRVATHIGKREQTAVEEQHDAEHRKERGKDQEKQPDFWRSARR